MTKWTTREALGSAGIVRFPRILPEVPGVSIHSLLSGGPKTFTGAY